MLVIRIWLEDENTAWLASCDAGDKETRAEFNHLPVELTSDAEEYIKIGDSTIVQKSKIKGITLENE